MWVTILAKIPEENVDICGYYKRKNNLQLHNKILTLGIESGKLWMHASCIRVKSKLKKIHFHDCYIIYH